MELATWILVDKEVDEYLHAIERSPGVIHYVCEGGVPLNVLSHCQAASVLPLCVTIELQIGPVVQ